MANKKKKIALVNQRYGAEVNGGSEYYTRQLALHLRQYYEVEILTTTAFSYDTWENYYTQGTEKIDGITVRRFHVDKPRNVIGMKVYNRLQRYSPFGKQYFQNKWIDAQGPYSSGLIQYITEHSGEYDLFVFVTYLYYHTVRGIPVAAEKAVLIPTAHDEPYIRFSIFRELFAMPKAFVYLTPEEKQFVEKLFAVSDRPNCVAGSGVELPVKIDHHAYRSKYGIEGEYLIYVGRIDSSKGCDEMFRIFQSYKECHPSSSLKLVLMGRAMMELPEHPDIIYQGFVSEEDKFGGISGACALWLPSKYESLSIAVLEAMSLGIPVLVNGQCEVLKGHCERSGAGIAYLQEQDAAAGIELLENGGSRERMGGLARSYVEENYQWQAVIGRIRGVLEQVMNRIDADTDNRHT